MYKLWFALIILSIVLITLHSQYLAEDSNNEALVKQWNIPPTSIPNTLIDSDTQKIHLNETSSDELLYP